MIKIMQFLMCNLTIIMYEFESPINDISNIDFGFHKNQHITEEQETIIIAKMMLRRRQAQVNKTWRTVNTLSGK